MGRGLALNTPCVVRGVHDERQLCTVGLIGVSRLDNLGGLVCWFGGMGVSRVDDLGGLVCSFSTTSLPGRRSRAAPRPRSSPRPARPAPPLRTQHPSDRRPRHPPPPPPTRPPPRPPRPRRRPAMTDRRTCCRRVGFLLLWVPGTGDGPARESRPAAGSACAAWRPTAPPPHASPARTRA